MRQKTIFMGGFHLESNTSNPVPVEYEDFVISRGIDMLPCFSEATAVFREAGYSVLPSLYAESICVAGGVLSLNAFRHIAMELLDSVPLDGSINGIWLYLHGSMQVEFLGSGEAFIVSAIRERVGPSVPISIALDFHGNLPFPCAQRKSDYGLPYGTACRYWRHAGNRRRAFMPGHSRKCPSLGLPC